MPSITELDLKRHLKSNELARVYLIYGTEDYLKKLYCKQLCEKAVSDSMREFNLMQFEGAESSVDEIADTVELLPVMAQKRCVIVRDLNADTFSAADLAKWTQLLEDPPETCVLLLRLDTVEVNARKSAKWRNFIKKIDAVGCSIELKYRDAASLSKTLCAAAAKLGCVMSPHTAHHLVSVCGMDLQTLFLELEKVCAYAGKTEITKEHIDAVAIPTLEANAFDLVRAINRKESGRAFHLLDILFAKREEPIVILAALCAAYADLFRAKIAASCGVSAESLKNDFDYRGKEFRLKNAARDAAKTELPRLQLALDVLAKADQMLKGSRTGRRIIMEQTVAALLQL